MKRYRWIPWGIALFLILFACQSPPTLNTTYVSSQSESQAAAQARKALVEKIRNKKPYLGPVRISLNQDLLENSGKSKSLDLTAKLNESLFHTQSLPSGTVIYQETFVTSQQTSENLREFSIASTYKRYTLHAQRFGQGGQVKVLINGEQWFKESDFDKNGEAERPGLLLNTQNSLLVNLNGQPGTSLTITVVEGGDAGTVLRQRGQLGMPGEKQSDHVRQGDINIFDPYDLSSLGGLMPYQGDLSTPASGSSRAIRISGLRANELPMTRFESGVLVFKFKDPQVGLEVMKNHYGAQVMDQVDEFYYLSLDLTTSPIERIVELIHGYNQHSDGDIESIAFSSLASMQTYAIALDVLMRFPNQLESLDFNQVGIPPATFDDLTVTHNGSAGISSIQDCNGQPAKSWWLTQTNTDKAWDLSIGTGVKVAWIDRGYDFSANGVDLDARRLKFNLSSLNKNESYISDSVSDNFNFGNNPNPSYVECAKYHAQCAMMTGFAERDNTKQTVGVAPNVTVIPFKVGAGDYAKALREARTIGADVIGLNMGWPKSIGGYFMFAGDSIVGTFGGDSIKDQIIKGIKEGRPVIMAAHNYHQSLNDWMIVDLLDDPLTGNDTYLKQLIVVGNATPLKDKTIASVPCPPSPNPMPNPTPPAPPLGMYAYYSIVYDGLPWYAEKNGAGSNYGPNMIWAPGDSIYIANRPNSPYFSSNPIISFGGTSAATPFVTGVVALMKSRDPGLQPHRVKEILLSSKAQALVPNPGMARAGISAHLLDVEQAVRTAAREANPNFATAKTYYAYVTQGPSPTGRQLRLNQFARNTAPLPPNAAALERIKSMEEQTVSQSVWDAKLKPGMYLRVTGWSNVLAGRIEGNNRTFGVEDIEILDADAICDGTSQGACTSPPLIFEPRISQIDFAPLTGSTPPGFIPKAANGFIMTFTGTNLLANLKDGFDHARFTVNFQPLLGGNPTVGFSSVPIPGSDVIEVSNDGTLVKVRIDPNKVPGNTDYAISLSGATQSGFFRKPGSGDYHIQSTGPGDSSSCDPNEKWSVRAYNVDDTATAYLNQNPKPVLNYSYQGETGFINITNQLHPGTNHLAFKIHNENRGYAWGFEVKKNTEIVYHIEAGQAGIFGANNNDQSKPNQNIPFNGNSFTFSANPCPFTGGGFSISSISDTVPPNPPPQIKVWLTRNSQQVEVNSSNFIGIGIDTEDIASIDVEIDGQSMPIGYLAEKYLAFGIPADMSPGVKDVIIKLAGGSQVTLAQAIKVLARPPLEMVQGISTQNAISLKSFNMQNTPHLAVANSGEFKIYRWNGNQFNEIQNIYAEGGYDVEEFKQGNDQYLVLSNHAGGLGWYTVVYKWNGSQFINVQYLHTMGGTDGEVFTIGNDTYLATASNGYSSWQVNETSRIYKWNGSQFVEIQSFSTIGTFKWEHFKIGSDAYLGYVNYKYSGAKNTLSPIYKWNGSQFEFFQQLPGSYPQDMETFSIGDDHFLALSNYGDQVSTPDPNANQMNSVIYKWNGNGFVPFQNIPTQGGKRWKYFSSTGRHYLMNANDYNSARLYRWTGSNFELYRTFLGSSSEWEWVTLQPGEHLLVGARYNQPIEVYRFE